MTEQVTEPVQENENSATEGSTTPGEAAREPRVIESRKYRKRAQAAEQALTEAQRELQQARQALREHEQAIAGLERRQRLDELLFNAGALDVETVRLLLEQSIAGQEEPDLNQAVARLRQRKPLLFRGVTRPARAQAPGVERDQRLERAQDAAAQAQATGKRGDLLRYLRLRRRAS